MRKRGRTRGTIFQNSGGGGGGGCVCLGGGAYKNRAWAPREGGGGDPTVCVKWLDQIFPTVSLAFSHDGPFGLEGLWSGGGSGLWAFGLIFPVRRGPYGPTDCLRRSQAKAHLTPPAARRQAGGGKGVTPPPPSYGVWPFWGFPWGQCTSYHSPSQIVCARGAAHNTRCTGR